MKQTATEWMANELLYLDNEYDMKLIDKNEYQARRKQIIEQAKTMEKEQHKKTWSEGMFCETGDIQAFEQYYNKNFKNAN
jgi:hypothetical protein